MSNTQIALVFVGIIFTLGSGLQAMMLNWLRTDLSRIEGKLDTHIATHHEGNV